MDKSCSPKTAGTHSMVKKLVLHSSDQWQCQWIFRKVVLLHSHNDQMVRFKPNMKSSIEPTTLDGWVMVVLFCNGIQSIKLVSATKPSSTTQWTSGILDQQESKRLSPRSRQEPTTKTTTKTSLAHVRFSEYFYFSFKYLKEKSVFDKLFYLITFRKNII